VSYIPATKVLFGGCILKEVDATKGNLADADTTAWSGSIGRIRQRYPQARVLVPGHGDYGGQELLHYTEKLFR
jgi:metallo-beta-lactamase class B